MPLLASRFSGLADQFSGTAAFVAKLANHALAWLASWVFALRSLSLVVRPTFDATAHFYDFRASRAGDDALLCFLRSRDKLISKADTITL
jgi:hypothetical protein